ncbi:hypothetical protein HUW46_07228 [Amycolatopsis sp. CA-230715]|nr:hypothetical protein HUW46_07228 [Amycolatopsis sp. CA-230715]
MRRDQLEDLCTETGIAAIAVDVVLDAQPRYPDIDSREQPPLEPIEQLDQPDDYLYVPSRPVREGQYQVELELQPDNSGRPLMLAYTSPELLAAGCGEFQPWVALHANDVPNAIEESGAHGVLLNPVLAEQSRHTGPVHDWDTHSIVGWS